MQKKKVPKKVPKKVIPKKVIPKKVPKKVIPKKVPKKVIPKKVPKKQTLLDKIKKVFTECKPKNAGHYKQYVAIKEPQEVQEFLNSKTSSQGEHDDFIIVRFNRDMLKDALEQMYQNGAVEVGIPAKKR
jgi:hypothetical protein